MFWSLKPALRSSSGRAVFSNVQFAEEAEKASLLGDSRYDDAPTATAAESVAETEKANGASRANGAGR